MLKEYPVNQELSSKIQQLDFQGKTAVELKPLYIQRNTLGVSLDIDIFRIFQARHFLEDVTKSRMTLSRVRADVFKDSYENPLLNKYFKNEEGELIRLNGLVENCFAQCWTEEQEDEDWRWTSFTHGHDGVRVKASLSALINELTNTSDEFFMLKYFAGKVEYWDEADIDKLVGNSHYSYFLDSAGQRAALSLMALRDHHEDEKEIRILYSYFQDESEFVRNNIAIEGNLCRHPFNWKNIIQEVLVDPRMTKVEFDAYAQGLTVAGLTCPIRRSYVNL